MSNKYQDQKWYVKLARRRHQLFVPIEAVITYIRGDYDDLDEGKEPFSLYWDMALSMADIRMKWILDWEDFKKEEK